VRCLGRRGALETAQETTLKRTVQANAEGYNHIKMQHSKF
jgi:hypothetical protein